jgi:hypothetical protein
MKWEGLNLHVENLVPGVITLFLLLSLVPKSVLAPAEDSAASVLLANQFAIGGLFVAASYLIGIFTVAVCRCVIDPISAVLPRPWLFKLFYPKFRGQSAGEVSRQYHDATQTGLASENEYKRTETKNRRERGRLVRSGILPLALFVWYVSAGLSPWIRVTSEIVASVLGVLLYAYVELTIYQESGLGRTP